MKIRDIYQYAHAIDLSYENWPLGMEFTGYIGYINNEWMYARFKKKLNSDIEETVESDRFEYMIINDKYTTILIIYEFVYTICPVD